MNNTQKALWFSGIFSAVLTAVIVSVVNDARHKLEQAVIDIAKHDVRIGNNSENIDDVYIVLNKIEKNGADQLASTNDIKVAQGKFDTRLETSLEALNDRLDTFEPAG